MFYKHFKGKTYEVLHEATDSETKQEVVIYKDENGKIWSRPKTMFYDFVNSDTPRFTKIESAELDTEEKLSLFEKTKQLLFYSLDENSIYDIILIKLNNGYIINQGNHSYFNTETLKFEFDCRKNKEGILIKDFKEAIKVAEKVSSIFKNNYETWLKESNDGFNGYFNPLKDFEKQYKENK